MSLIKLDQKLDALLEKLHQQKKIEERLTLVDQEIALLHSDVGRQNKVLDKEKKDVEELEKLNMKSLFVQVLGDKEERLEKERQEYLQEVLKYNALLSEIEVFEFEKKILSKKASGLKLTEKSVEELISKKEAFLKLKGGPLAKAINKFDLDIKLMKINVLNLKEAIEAGNTVMLKMNALISYLQQVKSWNGRAILTGKGRYSSYNKKSYIDKANKEAINAKVSLARFEKELRDVYKDAHVNASVVSFERFITIFYNHLITDWVLQQNLNNAYYNITNTKNTVNRYILTLQADMAPAVKAHDLKTKEKRDFVANNKVS